MSMDSAQQTPTAEHTDESEWVKVFVAQRKRIEQGIRERLPSADRARRLEEADNLLPVGDSTDSEPLHGIADRLEEKLQEMIAVVHRGGDPRKGVRLPPNFDRGDAPEAHLEALLAEVSRDERLWLFTGGVREILYRFRDQGTALVLEERNRLLKALSVSVRRMETAIGELNAHPVVAQALDAADCQRIEQTREATLALVSRYETLLRSREDGVASLLEDNDYQLQGQFIAACAQLCLQLYGNVSNQHLRDLLSLKAIYWLSVTPANSAPDHLSEAERKHLERKRNLILRRAVSRAKKELWPTWPILQLYNYDPRFGRLPARATESTHDEGGASFEMPTDRSGTPLAGW
ncbi:hypothetical protein [Zoogloea sp.]|uniref:hypothetical protein n=1 Tax=Zoogloea sp. TaxID=49181 RepID=UPI0035B07D3A